MIPVSLLPEKPLEQILSEAMAAVPVYSREWTNLNRSDPGVTILETLSAFHLLQQNALSQMDDSVRLRLLGLAGYFSGEYVPARGVLKLVSAEDSAHILKGTKFASGGLIFETTEARTHTNADLLGAYYLDGKHPPVDLLHILEELSRSSGALFADEDGPEAALYILLTLPPLPNAPLTLRLELNFGEIVRNPLGPEPPAFACPEWALYTGNGWETLECDDETHGFLQSGNITLRMPAAAAAAYDELPTAGCCLRVRALKRAFDLPPRFSFLGVDLLPVRQQNTLACTERFACAGGDRLECRLEHALALCGGLRVFCREEDGRLREYFPSSKSEEFGRFYTLDVQTDGRLLLRFDAARGFFPAKGADAVRVLCCDSEFADRQELGYAYGYDGQVFETGLSGIISSQFELMVREFDKDGTAYYFSACPEAYGPDAFRYRIDPIKGTIELLDTAFDRENLLLVSACAVTFGADGNLRGEGGLRLLRPAEGYLDFPMTAFLPVPAEGGESAKMFEELRRALSADLKTPYAAVTAQDWEEAAKNAPGLCIHKAHAYAGADGLLELAVKPYGAGPRPALSPLYCQELQKLAERRRILGTRVRILSPAYVPIDLQGEIIVGRHYSGCRAEIEQCAARELDYVSTGRAFGAELSCGELSSALAKLACVVQVKTLSIETDFPRASRMGGGGLRLPPDALCYLRRCRLEILPRALLD